MSLDTILGSRDKAVNKTKSPLSFHSGIGDIVLNKQLKPEKRREGMERKEGVGVLAGLFSEGRSRRTFMRGNVGERSEWSPV